MPSKSARPTAGKRVTAAAREAGQGVKRAGQGIKGLVGGAAKTARNVRWPGATRGAVRATRGAQKTKSGTRKARDGAARTVVELGHAAEAGIRRATAKVQSLRQRPAPPARPAARKTSTTKAKRASTGTRRRR